MSPEKQMYQMSIRLGQLLGSINHELNKLLFQANKAIEPHEIATNQLLRQTESWKRELQLYSRQVERIENLTAMETDRIRGRSQAAFNPERDRLTNRNKLLAQTTAEIKKTQAQLTRLLNTLLVPSYPEAMAKAIEHLSDRVEQAQEMTKLVEKAQRVGTLSPAEGQQIKTVIAQYRPPSTPHSQGQGGAGMDLAGLTVLAAMAYATVAMLLKKKK